MADSRNQPGNGPIRSEFAGDPEMKELIELFLQELPVRIESLRAAHQAGDAAAVKRIAHQLRGASAGYGYPALGSVAATLEEHLRSLPTSATPEMLGKIGADINHLVDMCRRACAA